MPASDAPTDTPMDIRRFCVHSALDARQTPRTNLEESPCRP